MAWAESLGILTCVVVGLEADHLMGELALNKAQSEMADKLVCKEPRRSLKGHNPTPPLAAI